MNGPDPHPTSSAHRIPLLNPFYPLLPRATKAVYSMTSVERQTIIGESGMGTVRITDSGPLIQFGMNLSFVNPDENKGGMKGLTDITPIEINHLGPGPAVEVLTALLVNPVHGQVSVTHHHCIQIRITAEQIPSLILKIEEQRTLLRQGLHGALESEQRRRAAHDPGLQKVKHRKQNEFQSKNRIKEHSEKGEYLERPDFIQISRSHLRRFTILRM